MKNYVVYMPGNELEVSAKKFVINESLKAIIFKGTEENDEEFIALFSLDTIFGFAEYDYED